MDATEKLTRFNTRHARARWGRIVSGTVLDALRSYSEHFQFAIAAGDLLLLESGWYVTHSGLIRLARRNGCAGIRVEPASAFCDASAQRWAFKATVYKSRTCRGFVGYGDADPSNVSQLVRGAEMRIAETRAVNRALRKAYGIGICSFEEIGSIHRVWEPDHAGVKMPPQSTYGNVTHDGKGGPRVRDRLVQLIHQYQLDPDLVKAYAVDFCGAKTLKEATRNQVLGFVDHLAEWAAKDRDALVCQLNSYPRVEEKTQDKAGAA